MCNFFSFVTEPENHGGKHFYFNWKQRQEDFKGADSHDHIIQHYNLNGNICNTYEYNPLTKKFVVDQINSETNDKVRAEQWVTTLDFKKIIKPLIIKPIIHPFEDMRKVTHPIEEHILLLKKWASVGDSVGASVRDSVWTSVRAYISSFLSIKYKYDFTPAIHLWEQGLVPSFDGTIWRLHSGKNADIVFEISAKELKAK